MAKKRIVSGPMLDVLAELTRSQQSLQPLSQSDELLTALAHLLGFDGSKSVAIRATAAGVLKTEVQNTSLPVAATPYWAANKPTASNLVTAAPTSTTTLDLTTAVNRLVVISVHNPNATALLVYDSVTAAANSRIVASLGYGGGHLAFFAEKRYLDFGNSGSTACYVCVHTYAL